MTMRFSSLRPCVLLACMAAAVGSANAATVVDFDFSEGSGNTINSSVGGITGTLMGFTDTSAGAGNTPLASGWTSDGRLSLNNSTHIETTYDLGNLIGSDFTVEFIATHADPSRTWSPMIGQSAGCCFFFGKRTGVEEPHHNFNGLGSGHSAASPTSDGLPHHWAVVFDNTANTITTYFDHVQIAQRTGVTGTLTDRDFLWIGGVAHAGGEHWEGLVDHVRLHDSVVAPANFLSLPAAATPLADLAADYMDGTAGQTSSDVGIVGSQTGMWSYYSDTDNDPTNGGLTLLTFGAVGLEGGDGFGGTGTVFGNC